MTRIHSTLGRDAGAERHVCDWRSHCSRSQWRRRAGRSRDDGERGRHIRRRAHRVGDPHAVRELEDAGRELLSRLAAALPRRSRRCLESRRDWLADASLWLATIIAMALLVPIIYSIGVILLGLTGGGGVIMGVLVPLLALLHRAAVRGDRRAAPLACDAGRARGHASCFSQSARSPCATASDIRCRRFSSTRLTRMRSDAWLVTPVLAGEAKRVERFRARRESVSSCRRATISRREVHRRG